MSVQEAIEKETKAKVETVGGQKLKFKRLKKANNQLVGITKKRSTEKYLDQMGYSFEQYGKWRHYTIESLDIEHIYPKNKTASTLVNIGVVILSVVIAAVIAATVIVLAAFGG